MIDAQINDYYRKKISSNIVLLTTLVISFVTCVFLIYAKKTQSEKDELTIKNKLDLLRITTASLKGTFNLIGKSSHSIIALEFADYAGYRQVVQPWIENDDRIVGYILLDNNSAIKSSWSKSNLDYSKHTVENYLTMKIKDNLISYKIPIINNNNNKNLGSIVFFTTLEVSGLKKLGLGSENKPTFKCEPYSEISGSFFCSPKFNFTSTLKLVFVFFIICGFFLIALSRFLIRKLTLHLQRPLQKLHEGLTDIQKGESVNWKHLIPKDAHGIFLPLGDHFSNASTEYHKLRSTIEFSNKLSSISKQVAHDIRSPLSALNIITNTLTDVPEEKRLLIRNSVQRINDIANDLLQKGKSTQNSPVSKVKNDAFLLKQNCSFLISTVIDNIVSEKRIQYREKMGVSINVDLKNSFGLFVNANPNELSRVISNLINNSVEALPDHYGNIDVSVFSASKNNVSIQIKDNGSGIPKHILSKLGQTGVTHGKDNSQSGSGLGVYHAIKTIHEFGGTIIFQSVTSEDLINSEFTSYDKSSSVKNAYSNTGTNITIELPKADTPSWFAESIQLTPGQEIVTVDDDISIHQIWKGRLQSLKSNVQNIKLTSFTSAKEFREYFNKNLNSNMSSIFLIDYEFLNQNDNGLKIITDLGIQDKAILVTSRFDEPNIRSECEAENIKILPKQLAGQIGISIMPSFDHSTFEATSQVLSTESTDFEKSKDTLNISNSMNSTNAMMPIETGSFENTVPLFC